jgi:hypothetical protein
LDNLQSIEKPCGIFTPNVRTMQTVPDITEYQEMHIWNTVLDTIGPHSMKTGFASGSNKDHSHCELTGTKTSPKNKRNLREHMILQEIHQPICADHNTNGKVVKEGYQILMERRVSTLSRYLEENNCYRTDIIISRLGKGIPCACRCIDDSTGSYLSSTRSEILGLPDSVCKKKIIRLRTKL